MNGNGIQDDDEPGIPGVTVELYQGDSCSGEPIATTITDVNGYYLFTDLLPGEYVLRIVPPDGYRYTTPDRDPKDDRDSDADPSTGCTAPVNLEAGEIDVSVDAGLVPPPSYRIFLPIILTPDEECRVARVNATIWGRFYSFPLDGKPHVVSPLPWQAPTTFRLFNYTGERTWYLYEPYYERQEGGDSFTYEGGYPGEPFSLYLFTDCGFTLISSHIDPPLLTRVQLEAIFFRESVH